MVVIPGFLEDLKMIEIGIGCDDAVINYAGSDGMVFIRFFVMGVKKKRPISN